AALPLLATVIAPTRALSATVAGASLVSLAALGATGARIGGARVLRGTVRAMFWGALAMATTTGIGALFGARLAG
ncbi:MAG TPA: VIT1/CCC1 transporter family protein, partial [Caulobacteraceae bacterium]